jgi:putative NIF3 family GTP cyclohydrolase 1 type 2
MKVKDVATLIQSIAPLIEGDDSGLLFGDINSRVEGIMVCWSPTLEVIKTCQRLQCNLIVAHEWLLYFNSGNKWLEVEQPTFAKTPNLKRLELLIENKITVLRYHRNWDTVEGGTADTLGKFLGFGDCVSKGFFTRVYKIDPITLADLSALISERLQTDCVYHGDPRREITHVGIACGGVGQTFTFGEEFLGTPAEVIVFGETLEYTEIYTRELGYDYIVASHEASETPGLMRLTNLIRDKVLREGIPIHFASSLGRIYS